jgi:hypothetical protein
MGNRSVRVFVLAVVTAVLPGLIAPAQAAAPLAASRDAVYRSQIPACTFRTHWHKEPATGTTKAIVLRYVSTCTSFQSATVALYRETQYQTGAACDLVLSLAELVFDDTGGCAPGVNGVDRALLGPVVHTRRSGTGTLTLTARFEGTFPGMPFRAVYSTAIENGFSDGATSPCYITNERFGPFYRCTMTELIIANPV